MPSPPPPAAFECIASPFTPGQQGQQGGESKFAAHSLRRIHCATRRKALAGQGLARIRVAVSANFPAHFSSMYRANFRCTTPSPGQQVYCNSRDGNDGNQDRGGDHWQHQGQKNLRQGQRQVSDGTRTAATAPADNNGDSRHSFSGSSLWLLLCQACAALELPSCGATICRARSTIAALLLPGPYPAFIPPTCRLAVAFLLPICCVIAALIPPVSSHIPLVDRP